MMKRTFIVLVAAAALLASSCSAKGAEEKADADNKATTTAATGDGTTEPEGGDGKFGTLDSPCGDGSATIKADEAGTGADKLYIGVANDRTSIRPGLLKELFDGASGFAAWCNEQGGVGGLPIEVVDLDGKLFEIEAAMAKACTGVFALVGGGYAQDNLIFTGKDGSDMHKCGMIALPGFAVSTEYSEASDVVQALPNPPHRKAVSHQESLVTLYPEKADKYGVVYGNLPSIVQNKDQTVSVAKGVDGFGTFAEISYDPVNQDWSVIAQQVIDKGLELITFIGEPSGLSKLSQALKDQAWDGVITADANQYDSRLFEISGPAAVDGVTVKSSFHPLEEADAWPAIKQFTEIMDKNVQGWQHAALAIQAFSSTLMFATVAKECADEGEISRTCVLEKALAVDEWDGGGLHAAANPGTNEPTPCSMVMQAKDGVWSRLYPEIDGDGDDGDGFRCGDIVDVEGDFGEGDKTSSILPGGWPR